MVDFLKDLSFLILPLGLGSKRLDFFEKQIIKYSGEVKRNKSKPSHVIIDESVGENREKCMMALKTYEIDLSGDVKLVGTKWLSKCFAEKRLLSTELYEFDWVTTKHLNPAQDGLESSLETNAESSSSKRRKFDPKNYLCSQSSTLVNGSRQKQLIVHELQKLADAFTARNDTWRAYSYGNAVSAIQRYDKDITTFQEACQIPGIGERMALKIMEIIECGKLEKVTDICDEKTKILEEFCNIWGVGPSTAEIWYQKGYRCLNDLKERGKLSRQQEIGLKYYHDFMERMTRKQVEEIASVVTSELGLIPGHCRLEVVGSYRRGKPTCGDVDLMIMNPGPKQPKDILLQLTDRLKTKGYLTDDLVTLDDATSTEGNHRKYMGVFRFPKDDEIHRRIDIFVIPEAEYAAALMHYTGSAMFNRSIRLLAARKGLTLNEHGLYTGIIRKGSDILNEGERVPTPTEKEIFDFLGLEFKSPEERDH